MDNTLSKEMEDYHMSKINAFLAKSREITYERIPSDVRESTIFIQIFSAIVVRYYFQHNQNLETENPQDLMHKFMNQTQHLVEAAKKVPVEVIISSIQQGDYDQSGKTINNFIINL